MSEAPRQNRLAGLDQIRQLLVSQEPQDAGSYISVPQIGQRYHRGTMAPVLGNFTQTAKGLWVPAGARLSPDPLDNAHMYVTLREVTEAPPNALLYLIHVLERTPVHAALLTVASAMSSIRSLSDEDGSRTLDRGSLQFFNEPVRTRLSRRIERGAVIHAPQLLMVLTKLILRHCPDEVSPTDQANAPLSLLLMIVADAMDPLDGVQQEEPSIDEIALELAANSHFNAPIRIDSHLAEFQRRWIEMPQESTSQFLDQTMEQVFEDATGDNLLDQIAVCFAIYTGVAQGRPTISADTYFANVGWEPSRYEPILDRISLPLDQFRATISQELSERSVDWHFSTFERYPLIKSGNNYLVLDAHMALRRSVGFLPYFDIQDGYAQKSQKRKMSKVRRAFDDYAERYAGEALRGIAQNSGQGVSVFDDGDFRRQFKNQRIADFAVDYGHSVVVVEVTTSQPQRDTVNAVSTASLTKDIGLIVDEAEQVSDTIDAMRRSARGLAAPPHRFRYFPVVVLAEGFPNNFLLTGRVREAVARHGILQGADVAPLELMKLEELDILEDQAKRSGFTIPQLLSMKAESNFQADSIKNFLLSDRRFTVVRTERVEEASHRFFELAMKQFGWKPNDSD